MSDTAYCVMFDEPPDADPHVRWCGRGGAVRPPPIPIDAILSPSDALRIGSAMDLVVRIENGRFPNNEILRRGAKGPERSRRTPQNDKS
jgi:hypothetical protein